jgi:hypothetical protein
VAEVEGREVEAARAEGEAEGREAVVVAAREAATPTGRARRAIRPGEAGGTTRPASRRREASVISNEVMSLAQNAANPLVRRMQEAADERGHGRATQGAGLGGLLGAMAGSFGGLWWALLAAGVCAAIGYSVGEALDERD